MNTISLQMTIQEALDMATLARQYAERERADAEGKMHNAAMSRIASAERFEELAERMEVVTYDEQNRRNAAQSGGVRKFMAARRAAANGERK